MATLKDVAKKSGVSIATVSYCINHTKSVKPSTRTKIMQAIEELNYIPNTSARNLKKETSKEIGIVLPDIDDLCHSEILKGIISAAESANYLLNIAFSYNTPKLECNIINQFIGKNMAGIILVTCQPQNSEFFQNSLIRNNIPSVFIERFPDNIDANFLAFDNYQSCYYLTKRLIEHGYSNIFLMAGYSKFFSENECIRGFFDAHDDLKQTYSSNQIMETALSKEAAFRHAMLRLIAAPPQAIIVSSESLAKGLMEAFNLCGIRVPDQTCILTLGEECWNETNYLPNLIHTSRTAYTLGQSSIQVLLKNIKAPEFYEKEFMLFKDNILENQLKLPKAPPTLHTRSNSKRVLRIVATSLPTLLSLHAVSAEFEKQKNVKIEVDFLSYNDLFNTILADASGKESKYDIYLYDVSWLTYLASTNVLADITDLLTTNEVFSKNLVHKNLENCCYKGHYYGFPIVGGSHLLFYRQDLFENPALQKQFESQHNLPLRPPKTWTEFNGIAQFFTKEFNPYSPTLYGTSVMGSIHEEITLEILIRLWSFGGGLYDRNGRLCLDTPQNIKGFQSLLTSCRFAESTIFNASIDQSFHAFGTGRTAMLLSFSEYASIINDCIQGDIITKVNYAMIPGQTPVNVGWHFGISKKTGHRDLIAEYFEWICKKQTSYYMTTLNGQSTVNFPYKNHEILKLYPWLEINSKCLEYAHSRIYPHQGQNRCIAPYEVEIALYESFKRMYSHELSVQEALRQCQKDISALVF